MSEYNEQAAFIEWVQYNLNLGNYPELEYMYAVPNGEYRPKKTGEKLRLSGVKKGVPDLCLPVPRGIYHGLYLETKWGDNTPSPDQKRWIAFLREQGYFVSVCYGSRELQAQTELYLSLEKP